MLNKLLIYIFILAYSPGIISTPPALAQLPTPSLGQAISFSAASPAEMGRKLSRAFEDFKAGLHPIVVALLYIGIVFGALIAFAVLVMVAFFLFMVFRRH